MLTVTGKLNNLARARGFVYNRTFGNIQHLRIILGWSLQVGVVPPVINNSRRPADTCVHQGLLVLLYNCTNIQNIMLESSLEMSSTRSSRCLMCHSRAVLRIRRLTKGSTVSKGFAHDKLPAHACGSRMCNVAAASSWRALEFHFEMIIHERFVEMQTC